MPPAVTVRIAVTRRAAPLALTCLTALALASCGTSNPTGPGTPIPPLSRVVLSDTAAVLRVGEFRTFSAVAYDTLGAPVDGVSFSWLSTAASVFTVGGTGRVRGVSEGEASLIVSAGGRSDTAAVVVIPAIDGWFVQPAGSDGIALNGVFFLADGRTGWAVGASGRIVSTADAGDTWVTRASQTGATLHAVWFTSALEGWAVGAGGTVLQTVNGGVSWTRRTNVGASETLMDVCFASRDTGWVVGGGGVILRTFDRGATWHKLYPTTANLSGVSFAGAREGWAVGDGGVILGTTDRGLSWRLVLPAVTAQSLRAVSRRSTAFAVAVGAQGAAPRTVASGDSARWENRSAGAGNALEGVHFPDDLVGYAVGSNGGGAVLRSDDGGLTWQPQTTHTSFTLRDVFFVDAVRGWAVGDNGTIVHTGTGGNP